MIFYIIGNGDFPQPFIVFFIMAVVTLFFIVYFYLTNTKLKRVYEKLALKRNGQVFGTFFEPRLIFDYNENKVLVYSIKGSRYSTSYTYIQITFFPASEKNLIIYNEKVLSKFGKALGMQDIQLGNPDFDSKFMIKGDDERFVKSLLPGYIQLLLLDIHRFNPYIYIENDKLIFRIPRLLIKEEDYDILIDASLKFITHYNDYKKMFLG